MLNSTHLSGKEVPQQLSFLATLGDTHVALGLKDKSATKKGTSLLHSPDWADTFSEGKRI